jgi:2-hydroxy-3-oxopropionate reductase
MPETVGFIGLGVMGAPMAGNLLEAGHSLVVHSRSPEPVEALAEAGAETASSPREVAERADVVITTRPPSRPSCSERTACWPARLRATCSST